MTPLDGPSRNAAPPREGSGVAKTPAAPFWPPDAAVLPPPLPPLAAKHDDLEAIKKAVEDAASVSGPLWLSYLFALFYIALAAAGVTHPDLLVENPVKLPFLNIELALKAFFILAPILFVILHAYTLMYFVLLGAKASQFHDRLKEQIPNDEKIREGLRRQLPSNIFVQFLAGPREFRDGAFGWLLKIIAWATLVVFPLALLLVLQLQFLPYHDPAISWTSRVAILADYLLIGWLWPSILGGRTGLLEGWRWWTGLKPQSVMAALGLATVIFSWGVATFPGEWEETPYSLPPVASLKAPAMVATDWVFGKPGGELDAQARNWLANRLRLPEFNIYEALRTKPDDLKWKAHSFDLQHRHLEYADLRLSKLDNINLRDARLRGASLEGSQLQGASLEGSQLQGASLEGAQLQGASLLRAQLQGASLLRAQLQGASLEGSQLQGASLEGAQLQGASLEDAQLQGASLGGAQLQGASLDDAQLQGASLGGAQLQGASLSGALFWRSDRFASFPLLGLTLFGTYGAETWFDEIDWSPVWRDTEDKEDHPWNDRSYGVLREMLEKIPEGDRRYAALKRVERLDCKKTGESLSSCDPKAKSPPRVEEWRSALEGRRERDATTYQRALAKVLSDLVCGGDADAIQVLRGLAKSQRIAAAGGEAAKLIKKIFEDRDGCGLSAALTAEDRAMLLEIKKSNDAKAEAAPSPPPAPEKQPEKQAQPSPAASKRENSFRTRSVP